MTKVSESTYPIARYLNVRKAYGPSFFSDGQRMAFLTDITGVPQVWETALPEKAAPALWPAQRTFETERISLVACSPVPGDMRLIYTRDVGGNEKMQLFLLDAANVETQLSAGYEDAMHHFGEWSDDGRRLLFAANRRDPALFDLYVQPLDGDAQLVWQNDQSGYLSHPTFSPDGSHALVTRTSSSFDHTLLEVDLEHGTARELLPADEAVRYPSAHYAADGHTAYVNTDLEADFLYIAKLDLDSGDLEPLVKPAWDCSRLTLSPNGHYLAYIVNVDGTSQVHVFDLRTGTVQNVPGLDAVPGVVSTGGLVFSPDSTHLAFAYTSAIRTTNVFIWELGTEDTYAVTRASHGGLPPSTFIAPTLVHYPTFDQDDSGSTRQIPAWFYQPPQTSDTEIPAILMVHGGPESQFRPAFHFLIQYFLHHGYAVLAPNVRGSTGYGKAYSHLDDVEKRMDSVADLAHAAYWLQAQPGIDGKRLIVYGGSYGGFMVLSALTTYPELWAAGVDIVGVANFVTFLENTSDYRRAHREAEYGSLAQNRDFLASISPANQLEQVAAPLIVIHGANDPRVPLSEAKQVVTALQARDIPVEFLVFDDEGHGLVKLKNKLVAYPAIVAFLNKYVSE